MSNFQNIEKLERGNEGLYNLYTTYFIMNRNVQVYGYRVARGEAMRIDSICYKLYKNTNHQSFILDLNNILNSFNIKEGDLLLYVQEDDIALFKAPVEDGDKIRQKVINKKLSDKKQQIDTARQDYINRRKEVDALPPNIKQNSKSSINVSNGKVKIILDKDQSEKAKNSR